MLAREDVEQAIRRNASLPTLPAIHRRLGRLLDSPWASLSDLAFIIREDQVLATRVLLRANAAGYAGKEAVSDVEGAAARLGLEGLRALLKSTPTMELKSSDRGDGQFSTGAFWRHGLGVAVCAREISLLQEDGPSAELAFMAGLIHDLGKLLWLQCFPQEFSEAVELASREKIPLHVAEQQTMGFTHTRCGRLLAKRWSLPDSLSEAIAFHHEPGRAQRHPRLVAIVHLADCFANALHLGHGGSGVVPKPDPMVHELLDLPKAAIPGLVGDIRRSYGESLLVLGSWGGSEEDAGALALP